LAPPPGQSLPPPPTRGPHTTGSFPPDADGQHLGRTVITTTGHLLSGFGHDEPSTHCTTLNTKGRLRRPLWLLALDEILVNTIEGIRSSHSTNDFNDPPLAFLTEEETALLADIRQNTGILAGFLNRPDAELGAYDELDLCLSCLKPTDPLTHYDKLNAMFKACGNDANRARESMFNTRHAKIDAAIDQWTTSFILYCKKAIVRTMIGLKDAPFDLTFNEEFQAWVEGQAASAMNAARESLTSLSTVPPTTVTEEWMAECMQAHVETSQAALTQRLSTVDADNKELFQRNVKAQDALLTAHIGQEEQNRVDELKVWQGRC
jgi:hypothetical protein